MILFLRSQTQKIQLELLFYFIYFFIKFTVKLKVKNTSSSAIAEGPHDALSQFKMFKSCQLLHNCTKNHIWLQGLPFRVVGL